MSETWPPMPGPGGPVIVEIPSELIKPGLSVGRAILLTLILIGLQIALGLIIGLAGAIVNVDITGVPLVIGAINILTFIIAGLLGLSWAKMRFRDLLDFFNIELAPIGSMIMTVMGLSILLSELGNYLVWLAPPPKFMNDIFDKILPGEGSIWQSLALLCLIAPMTEETLFRGTILRAMLRRYGAVTSIVVTSLLFAFIHLNPWQASTALFLGILFGWWYYRLGSIWPCIFGHMLNNAVPSLGSVVPYKITGFNYSPSEGVEFQPLWFDVAGLILFLSGILLSAIAFARMPRLQFKDRPIVMARPAPLMAQFPPAGAT